MYITSQHAFCYVSSRFIVLALPNSLLRLYPPLALAFLFAFYRLASILWLVIAIHNEGHSVNSGLRGRRCRAWICR